jgi:hypothetical protein
MNIFEWPPFRERLPSVDFGEDDEVVGGDEKVLERNEVYTELGIRAPPSSPEMNPRKDDEFTPLPWTTVQCLDETKSVPKLISALSTFPMSSIFATCFQAELDQHHSKWLDENGNLLSLGNQLELEEMVEKMEMLKTSIEFLSECIPPGR